MKDLSEYRETISEYELFSFFYDKIISKEVNKFSQLSLMAQPVLKNPKNHAVIMRLFELIKKCNWGFFADMSKNDHGKLWRELVIPDKLFPDAGDLKDTLQISSLYVAMLDIHGYTQFCMDSRKNLSMMHTLDHAMNSQAKRISTLCHAISQRERGDEVVVVAASATDALSATLGIIDFFGKTNYLDDNEISTKREGNTEALPPFMISAGITGGNTQSPLIITEKGNLAGFLLNSGARLQVRANELSGKDSRIMVAKQVQMNFLKENEKNPTNLFINNAFYFLDTGLIEFKGVQIPSCEAVFKPEDKYKQRLSKELTQLFNSIQSRVWEQKIFQDMLGLIIKTVQVMPRFSISPIAPIDGIQTITNDSIIQLCRKALKTYVVDEDYITAINLLKGIIPVIEEIPAFDKLILDYLKGVSDKYDMLLNTYIETMDNEVNAKANNIFQGNHLQAWNAAKNAVPIFEKLKVMGRKSNEITKKKVLWFSLIKQNSSLMEFVLHSGKK